MKILLDRDTLGEASLEGLERLARALRCLPVRTMGESDRSYKGRVIGKIMRTEAQLARGAQPKVLNPSSGGGWG